MSKIAPTSDNIATPDWCAKDMVDFFQPSGKVLDPCSGNGVFLKYLPVNSYSCEISQGKNFFDFQIKVDWVFGNPPYSIFRDWMKHSYEIADNIVYLIPSFLLFNPLSCLRMMRDNGLIKHMRNYDTGKKIEWSRSRQIMAIHIEKGYYGSTAWSFYGLPNNRLQWTGGESPALPCFSTPEV